MHRKTIALMLLAAAYSGVPMAQAQTVRAGAAPRARIVQMDNSNDAGDRAMLGISTMSSGKRDTLGLLIESVTPGSPADKAGLEEGNRIASVNGVNLRLSREDAGESDMNGTMTNRLIREMRKIKAGDEVALDLVVDGRHKNVRVKTVAADDLTPERMTRQADEDRPALGVSLGSSGSKRDTLGVFVQGVTDNGPADKAGIAEGDRIASINGVDLRTPREDVGDWSVAGSRVQRLQREIRKMKAGQTVDLGIVEGGRSRTVKVTLGRAKDLEKANGFSYSFSDGNTFMRSPDMPMPPMPPMPAMAPMTPMPPMPPMAPMAPRGGIRIFSDRGDDADVNLDGVRGSLEALRDIGPRVRAEIQAAMPRIQMDMPRIQMDMNGEMPARINDLRGTLERLRTQIPMIRARAMRGVII